MPRLKLLNQPLDICYAPEIVDNQVKLYVSFITGEIQSFPVPLNDPDVLGNLSQITSREAAEEQGHLWNFKPEWSIQPSQLSCRALDMSPDGERLVAVWKNKSMRWIDRQTEVVHTVIHHAHDAALNRVTCFDQNVICTGDDDGVVKFWDRRDAQKPIMTFDHHVEQIKTILNLPPPAAPAGAVLVTSGDGTLSVLEPRASGKVKFLAQSENQDDELLSACVIKQGAKVCIGTQSGIISLFNIKAGWADCVDRLPQGKESIDCMITLPSPAVVGPNESGDVIATGSSDGFIRAMTILPNQYLGELAYHGQHDEVERLILSPQAADGGVRWLTSISHHDVVRFTRADDLYGDESEEEDEGDVEVDGVEIQSEGVGMKMLDAEKALPRKRAKREEEGKASVHGSFFDGL